MQKWIRKYYLMLIICGIVVSIVSLNIMGRLWGETVSLDMTAEKHFSLSEYSKKEAKKLTLPLYVTIYYSEEIAFENPVYARYADFVLHFLEQYQKQNPEKIFITVKNPKPYSETEKEAKKAGIIPFLAASGQTNLYFGAVFSDAQNHTYTQPSFSQERSFWLEKDITTIIARFNRGEKDIVGLISPVHPMIKHTYGQQAENYALIEELAERYDILQLADNIKEIPQEVSVLLVVLPRKMSVNLKYALDQYVLRGGNLILLLDAWSEDLSYKTTLETITEWNKLLSHWGLEVSKGIIGSQKYGETILIKTLDDSRLSPYPLWLDLPKETFAETPILASLKQIRVRTAQEVKEKEHSDEIRITPLIQLSEGMLFDNMVNIQNKKDVVSVYKPDDKTHTIAALSEGKYQSMFLSPPLHDYQNKIPFLYYSAAPAKILVIGDSDFIRDDIWLQDKNLSDNGQFILRAVEIFNNQNGMADLYTTQPKIGWESLGQRLYNRIYDVYEERINHLQNELTDLRQEQWSIQEMLRQNKKIIDATTSRRLSELKQQIKSDEEELQFYDYEIKRKLQSQKQSIAFVNITIIPLILVLLMFVIYNTRSRRSYRKVEEKFNVGK